MEQNMNEQQFPVLLIPVLFIVAFAAIWSGVTVLLAYMSGWRALARRFGDPRPGRAEGEVRSGSARIGFNAVLAVNYKSVLTVRMGPEGVGLTLFRLFALASPPLLIPWSAMRQCRSWKRFGIVDCFRFETESPRVIVTLHGRSAVAVREAWFRWGAAAGATPDVALA
jgi:hypothetical protein